jgi:hypothetical protein
VAFSPGSEMQGLSAGASLPCNVRWTQIGGLEFLIFRGGAMCHPSKLLELQLPFAPLRVRDHSRSYSLSKNEGRVRWRPFDLRE